MAAVDGSRRFGRARPDLPVHALLAKSPQEGLQVRMHTRAVAVSDAGIRGDPNHSVFTVGVGLNGVFAPTDKFSKPNGANTYKLGGLFHGAHIPPFNFDVCHDDVDLPHAGLAREVAGRRVRSPSPGL